MVFVDAFKLFVDVLGKVGPNSTDDEGLNSILLQYDQALLESYDCVIGTNKDRKLINKGALSNPDFKKIKLVFNIRMMLPLLGAYLESINLVKAKHSPTKDSIDDQALVELEVEIRRLGADQIGYIKIPQNLVFKDKGIPYQNAIVITQRMDKKRMATAPSFENFVNVMNTYSRTGVIVNKVTKYLRKKGY